MIISIDSMVEAKTISKSNAHELHFTTSKLKVWISCTYLTFVMGSCCRIVSTMSTNQRAGQIIVWCCYTATLWYTLVHCLNYGTLL